MELTTCPVCGAKGEVRELSDRDVFRVKCPCCGDFEITEEAASSRPWRAAGLADHVMSGVLRFRFERNMITPLLMTDNMQEIIEPVRIPRSTDEKIALLLSYLKAKRTGFGSPVQFDARIETSVVFAVNGEECVAFIREAIGEGMAKVASQDNFVLTRKGENFLAEFKDVSNEGSSAFVAMRIGDPELDGVFNKALAPAIREAGYEPRRIDMVLHSDLIDNAIRKELKACRFVVADLTYHRPSVYYEVGYAQGIGKEVILCCHKDQIKDCGFDVSHYPVMYWDSPEDLTGRLIKMIQGRIGPGPLK